MQNDFFTRREQSETGSRVDLGTALDALRFDRDGLIAVIAQQFDTREVLMQAWMNRAALDRTLAEGRVVYWSRSRGKLWRKGETSGHQQRLVELRLDCDGDSILCLVDQQGPACHTERRSCYYWRADGVALVLDPGE